MDERQEQKKNKLTLRQYIRRLNAHIRTDHRVWQLYVVLRILVIVTLIRAIMQGNFESAMLCILSLFLFLVPSFFETTLKIQIPTLFEGIIYLFIFAAEILGEINHYYVLLPGWDTMLHTLNGFLCAAVGFSLVDLMNQTNKRGMLTPAYLALMAFCFSMTIGVVWEFFEFGMDQLFQVDMQKDFVVKTFGSVTLDPSGLGTPIKVKDITRTIIETASGQKYIIPGGYLDIGILDTMKDLLVNFIGAIVFSVIGYFYVKRREKRGWAGGLMIRRQTPAEKEQDREIFARMDAEDEEKQQIQKEKRQKRKEQKKK